MALRIVEDTLVRSTRFIPREQWFLAGDGHGCIHVRSCDTSNEVKKFQAHTSWVQSLSVHPSLPLLLSASWDMLIKLWDWEQVWMCLRVFKGHTDYLETVVFNPQNDSAGNVTFASVSLDGTAKVKPLSSLQCNNLSLYLSVVTNPRRSSRLREWHHFKVFLRSHGQKEKEKKMVFNYSKTNGISFVSVRITHVFLALIMHQSEWNFEMRSIHLFNLYTGLPFQKNCTGLDNI